MDPNETTVDCLVIAEDKVIRAMLATCARSVGLAVHSTGTARFALEAVGRRGTRYRTVLVGPKVEEAEAARVAAGLAGSGRVGRVLGYGLKPPEGGPAFEARAFPVDFVELFVELRAAADARGGAPAAATPVEATPARAA